MKRFDIISAGYTHQEYILFSFPVRHPAGNYVDFPPPYCRYFLDIFSFRTRIGITSCITHKIRFSLVAPFRTIFFSFSFLKSSTESPFFFFTSSSYRHIHAFTASRTPYSSLFLWLNTSYVCCHGLFDSKRKSRLRVHSIYVGAPFFFFYRE